MVMAGTRKRNTQGATKNKLSNEAYPPSGIFSAPGNTQRHNPVIAKKTAITKYPVRDEKNPCISFVNRKRILYDYR